MNTDLSGKRALVCGASRGIGRATAIELASLGADLILLARHESTLQETKKLCETHSVTVEICVADLEQHQPLKAKVSALVAKHPCQILINNAGGPPTGKLLEAEETDFLKAFNRHLFAAHALTKILVPGMRQSDFGRIINVISTSVYEPIPNLGVSNTVRGSMASWAKTLSSELPSKITINNVLPGFTATDRLAELKSILAAKRKIEESEIEAAWLAQVPEGRLAQPEETAQAIAFLASPAASYIRGVSLAVDGGRLKSL